MLKSVNKFLSASGKNMKRSAIKEILKHLQRPGMISFAGGLPAPETFPVNELKEITLEVLESDGAEGLQYGTTEGDPHLRKMLAERHNRQGMKPDELETTIIRLKELGKRIKFIYAIPDFQNPAGITLPEEIEKGVRRLSRVIREELNRK